MPSQTARLHQLSIDTELLAPFDLYPIAFRWQSAINKTCCAEILIFSYHFLDANACSTLLDSSICLTTLSASRIPNHRTGIIQSINYEHSDDALHFYSLGVVNRPDYIGE